MTVKVAINGFGRIGRLVFRAALEAKRKDIEFVAINDLGSAHSNAHLLKYDSVHGKFPFEVSHGDDWIDAGQGKIKIVAKRDPAELPWKEMGVDIALECTGLFASKEKASAHLAAGAKRVLVSAPCSNADKTVVYGVNHQDISKDDLVISNASCTTNCLTPIAKVIHENIGIKHGYMTTVHAFTGDQRTVDSLHGDLRRARAASGSMIPTSTGAAKAVGLVLPELKGLLDGTSIRVPLLNVSLVDLKVECKKNTSIDEVNNLMKEAANSTALKGVLAINEEPLVSNDFLHASASSTFDATQTNVVDDTLLRVVSWYDNEWGFSNRMSDTAVHIGSLLA